MIFIRFYGCVIIKTPIFIKMLKTQYVFYKNGPSEKSLKIMVRQPHYLPMKIEVPVSAPFVQSSFPLPPLRRLFAHVIKHMVFSTHYGPDPPKTAAKCSVSSSYLFPRCSDVMNHMVFTILSRPPAQTA